MPVDRLTGSVSMRSLSLSATAGGRSVRRVVAAMIRHPVLSSFLVALGIRVAFAVSSRLVHEGNLIPDEGHYLILAHVASMGELAGFWPGYGESAFDSTRAFMWPLVALFWLFGPVRFVVQLFSAMLGALTAAATAAAAGRVLRRSYALAAGLIVALLPSQILWSSVALRESLVWAGLAGIALVVGYSQRSSSVVRILGAALVAGLLFWVLVNTRVQTSFLALWCMFPALLFGRGQRGVRALSAIGVLAVAPLVVGMGLGAVTFGEQSILRLGSSHAYLSVSAESSFLAEPDPVVSEPDRMWQTNRWRGRPAPVGEPEPVVSAPVGEPEPVVSEPDRMWQTNRWRLLPAPVGETEPDRWRGRPAPVSETEPVVSEPDPVVRTTELVAVAFQSSTGVDCNARVEQELGEAYGIVDASELLLDRLRQEWMCVADGLGGAILVDNRLGTSLSRLPKGLFNTMVRPVPWETEWSNPDKFGAGLESPLWLVLYGLSGYCIWKHRKRFAQIAFPVLMAGGIAVSGAVTHGNLGTAFRHRGQILFALAILSAGGLQAIADRRSGRRNGRMTADSTEVEQSRNRLISRLSES